MLETNVKRSNAKTLEQLHAAGDHKALWLKALPLTKYAISTLIRSGKIRKEQSDDDFFQDCCLAAGDAARRWDPDRASFSRWIFFKVRGAAMDSLRNSNRGIHVPFDDERAVSDTGDAGRAAEWRVARAQVKSSLDRIDPESRELIQRRYGIGRPEESVAQIATSKGVARMIVHRMLVQAHNEIAASYPPTSIEDDALCREPKILPCSTTGGPARTFPQNERTSQATRHGTTQKTKATTNRRVPGT